MSETKVQAHKYNDRNKENAGAAIVTSLKIYPKEFNCQKLDNVKIVTQMNKLKSWAKEKSSEWVLNHEQTHFDIAEFYARKIRKTIQEFREESEGCDLYGIADIYYRLEEEHWQTQFLYDEETKHSVKIKKQQEWDMKIADSLKEYKDYELIIDIDELWNRF